MTIFHVIKYPISTPPTVEEFEALPSEFFTEWKTDMGFTLEASCDVVMSWYATSDITCNNDLQVLRERIKQMEGPL